MGDFDDIKWLIFLPIFVVIIMSILNGASFFTFSNITTQSAAEVPADCQSYKSQVEQQQAKIEQLDKDLSGCKSQNPSGFTMWDFLLGFAMGAGIVLFWAYWNEKERKAKEEWEKLNKSLSKRKHRRKK